MAKNKTTRNTKFNGYEFEKDGSILYASIASSSVEEINAILKMHKFDYIQIVKNL